MTSQRVVELPPDKVREMFIRNGGSYPLTAEQQRDEYQAKRRQQVRESTKRYRERIIRGNVTFQECPTCKRMIKTIGGKMIPHHKYRNSVGSNGGKWCK